MEIVYQVSRVSTEKVLSRQTGLMGAVKANLRRLWTRTVELTPIGPEEPRDGSTGWSTGRITIDVSDKAVADRLELGATVTLHIGD
jgi:hypothetical protein